jgi:hypothetical protein
MGLDGRGVYKDHDPTLRKSINTGYIVIPDGVNRVKFIEQCLRTERFSIQVEGGGGCMHNCYITKSALRDIKFPLEGQSLGSGVVFFTEPYAGKAIITGVVGTGSEMELNKEDVIVFKKSKDGNYALVSIDGSGQVNVDVIGIAQKGKLNINVRNDDFTGEVNVHVKGKISLYTEGNTTITTIDGDIDLITNQDVNITTEGDVVIDSNKLLVHEADEAMVRGDELKTQIDKTNDVVSAIVNIIKGSPIPEPGNGVNSAFQAALNTTLTGKVVGDFKDIRSEKSFLE